MKQESQFDLQAFVGVIRRRARLILAIGVGAMLLAGFVSLLLPDRYKADADLLFQQPQPAPKVDPTEPQSDFTDAPERIAATNLALASLDTVAARVKVKLKSPLSVEQLLDKVDLEPQGQADIVTITATDGSAVGAARLANAFADEVVALRREDAQRKTQRVIDAIEAKLAGLNSGDALAGQLRRRAEQLKVEKDLETGDVEIAEAAVPPRDRSSPKPLRNAAIGLLLGLLLGVVVAVLMQRFDRRVEDEEEVAEIVGAPLLARIPIERPGGWERELFLEAFQFLRANLQLRDVDKHQRVLAITSALPGNGKSTVAGRLAEALAVGGAEVIVVDCDLRRPTLHQYFGVNPDEGLTAALVAGRDVTALLQTTERHPSVRVLPAGPPTSVPASVLAGSTAMRDLLKQLRGMADYVIVDTSPVTIGADASAVASIADGTIVVVDLDTVRRDVLQAATEQLRGARAEVIGTVVNRAHVLLQDAAYRGYYGESGRSLFASEAEPPAAPRSSATGRSGRAPSRSQTRPKRPSEPSAEQPNGEDSRTATRRSTSAGTRGGSGSDS